MGDEGAEFEMFEVEDLLARRGLLVVTFKAGDEFFPIIDFSNTIWSYSS